MLSESSTVGLQLPCCPGTIRKKFTKPLTQVTASPSRYKFHLTHIKEEADASFPVFELADVEHHGEELVGAAASKKKLIRAILLICKIELSYDANMQPGYHVTF